MMSVSTIASAVLLERASEQCPDGRGLLLQIRFRQLCHGGQDYNDAARVARTNDCF
jgi:hypothetical protein